VTIPDDSDGASVAEGLAALVRNVGGPSPRILKRPDATSIAHTYDISEEPLFIVGMDDMRAQGWRHLDGLRSRLLGQRCVVLMLSASAMMRVQNLAPNLASWFGSSMWQLDLSESLSEDDKEQRLRALRRRFRKRDDQIIDLARQSKLPSDPEYAEWLVLLGKGDLL
jgi:hypothetical protein